MKYIDLNGRLVGDGKKTYIIAEMSANHANDINVAKNIIYKAKECGADCIKVQTYTADTLTIDCDNSYFSIEKGEWKDENLYSLYNKASMPWEWQPILKAYAKSIDIDFFSTPFDKSSVDFLESIDIDFYKIASFEIVDIPLIRYIASKGRPIILSTGMSTLSDIEDAVNAIKQEGNDQIALLRCASAYPAITSDMNLRTMVNMSDTFDMPVGLSDHSLGMVGAVTAVALGASIIEKHFCLCKDIESADVAFSMEPDEFKEMAKAIRSAECAIGSVRYGISEQEKDSIVFRKSIFVVKDVKQGDYFTYDNIRVIRPGHGLKPKYYEDIIGKRALSDINRGTPLKNEMIGI